jgi:hypothetical protein
MKTCITCTLPATLTRLTLITPAAQRRSPHTARFRGRDTLPSPDFLLLKTKLISAIPAEGRPAKIRERSNEFAITRGFEREVFAIGQGSFTSAARSPVWDASHPCHARSPPSVRSVSLCWRGAAPHSLEVRPE